MEIRSLIEVGHPAVWGAKRNIDLAAYSSLSALRPLLGMLLKPQFSYFLEALSFA
jgi:hypothetical protein